MSEVRVQMTDIGIRKWEGGLRPLRAVGSTSRRPPSFFSAFPLPHSDFQILLYALCPMPHLPVTRNTVLFFVHFFQISSTVGQIRPFVNIVYPDIPDDAFFINKNKRSFGYAIGAQNAVFISDRPMRPKIR